MSQPLDIPSTSGAGSEYASDSDSSIPEGVNLSESSYYSSSPARKKVVTDRRPRQKRPQMNRSSTDMSATSGPIGLDMPQLPISDLLDREDRRRYDMEYQAWREEAQMSRAMHKSQSTPELTSRAQTLVPSSPTEVGSDNDAIPEAMYDSLPGVSTFSPGYGVPYVEESFDDVGAMTGAVDLHDEEDVGKEWLEANTDLLRKYSSRELLEVQHLARGGYDLPLEDPEGGWEAGQPSHSLGEDSPRLGQSSNIIRRRNPRSQVVSKARGVLQEGLKDLGRALNKIRSREGEESAPD